MASESIIAELLRQDAEEKARRRAETSPQTIMAGIMQGIQLYDAVKGLGAKYGAKGKPAVPAQPEIPSITQQGASMGSQITPMTPQAFGMPNSTIGAGAQDLAGQGTYADLLKSVLPSGPGMNAPTIGQNQAVGQPQQAPNLQALLASMPQSTPSPAVPGTAAVPATPGAVDAQILQGLQNFPGAARQYGLAKGIDTSTITPEFKADQMWPMLLAKLGSQEKIAAGHDKATTIRTASSKAEELQLKRDQLKQSHEEFLAKMGEVKDQKEKDRIMKLEEPGYKILNNPKFEGDKVALQFAQDWIDSVESTGNIPAVMEERGKVFGIFPTSKRVAVPREDANANTIKTVHHFKASDGSGIHSTYDINAAKKIDPNLEVVD